MKRIAALALVLLLSPTQILYNAVVKAQDHGNYVPPYADEDEKNDDEYDHDDSDIPKSRLARYCNTLALSDSQNLGPYQAGVIKEMVHELKRSGETEYTVVSGISVGALNAHIMSQYKIGDEDDAADKLVDFWNKIAEKNTELVKSWSWGIIYGFFYENSIYDATELYEFINDYFKDAKL